MEKEDKKDATGLLFVLREDQLSLHKKYSALVQTVDHLTNEITQLKEEIEQLKQKEDQS